MIIAQEKDKSKMIILSYTSC